MTDDLDIYRRRYESFLQKIAANLKGLVASHVNGMSNIDQVTARAKDPERFAEKTNQRTETGAPKYENPLTEIQDQVGARIVVFYVDDVPPMIRLAHRYFHAIEEKELVPESHWEFGYFGTHLLLALPNDVVPPEVDLADVPRFFELQIKTLFQHAWSQANHDLGYKATKDLSGDQERRLAFTAAQAWGADRVFQELRLELS